MSMIALTTAALLLATGPASATTSDAVRVAAHGGFLLGNAHRCGIPTPRVVRAGQLVRQLILAAARDADEEERATLRFTEFFLTAAFPDKSDGSPVASCQIVASEFSRLERHSPAAGSNSATGGSAGPRYRPGAGE